MNDDTTSRFIASLVKSLQTLCHGYVDFEKNIEIIGHIYLNVDSQQKFDYVVNEQVSKTDDASPTTFISNSFHAKPTRKPVRTSRRNDSPLDLKTNSTKEVSGFDLSTFHSEPGHGRSASRESSQSLSAGSDSGSLSGVAPSRDPNSSTSIQGHNQDHCHVSRRKRHLLNNVSSKQSPNVSPSSRPRDHDQRNSHNSPVSRLQYTLGASASKLARRISNELDRQGHAESDPEIHSRLSASPAFQPIRHDNGSTACDDRLSANFSRSTDYPPDYATETPHVQDDVVEESVDLTRVKREVLEDDHFFEQLDWSKSNQDAAHDQDDAFPRTGPDEPACKVEEIKSDKELAAVSCLYPVMIHQNAAQMAGYGSPVFPQSFTEPPHSLSAGSSPVASTSGQVSPGSTFASRRPRPGGQGQGQERTRLNYGEFVHPDSDSYALSRLSRSGYREKLRQENPTKWMTFMTREKDRVRRERAILRERDDEQALLKKERIRVQNRLRKRKERHRKREQEMLQRLASEPYNSHVFSGQLPWLRGVQTSPSSSRSPRNK